MLVSFVKFERFENNPDADVRRCESPWKIPNGPV